MSLRKILPMLLLVLLVPSLADAVPPKLAQQGRILDVAQTPLSGVHAMSFSLYDAETNGNRVWTEDRNVTFEEGYYSVILGEQVPIDDLLFGAGETWLEVMIDGEALSPRQEIVSVPYALRATAAEHVEGGLVDAQEVSIDGTVVIDSSGAWVGPAPAVDWDDVTSIPPDIADGDQDTDTLAGLACAEGQLPKWDAINAVWICASDLDTTDPNTDTLQSLVCASGQVAKWDGAAWNCADDEDTQLTEPQVDALVANNGFVTTATDSDTLAALSCSPGEIVRIDGTTGAWVCDTETVTTSLPWSAVTAVPPDLADGDQDTLASLQCSADEIARFDGSSWVCAAEGSGSEWIQVFRNNYDSQPRGFGGLRADGRAFVQDYWRSEQVFPQSTVEVAASTYLFCALDAAGTVECRARTSHWLSAAAVANAFFSGSHQRIVGGQTEICTLTTTGSILCVEPLSSSTSTAVRAASGAQDLSVGHGGYGCFVDAASDLSCWGSNSYGQAAAQIGPFTAVSAGYRETCAVRAGGAVSCWGNSPDVNSTPVGTFVSVAVGSFVACALDAAGDATCWGLYNESMPPQGVSFSSLAGLSNAHCGLTAGTGEVLCWGGLVDVASGF